MSVSKHLGLSSGDTERLDSGEAEVYARTLLIGHTVIVLANIGTMRIVDGKKNYLLTIVGLVLMLIGLGAIGISAMLVILFLALGSGLIFFNVREKIDMYLELATNDGRTTIIISKERNFLEEIRSFLQRKIDTGSPVGATINISNSTLKGVFAMGDGANARHGSEEMQHE